jgi:hypothetical protein
VDALSKAKRWHRGGRFGRTYWLSDAQYSYASVTGSSLGWVPNIYGKASPKAPFRTLREAKAWVEKALKVSPKRSKT